jgi:hypothetical protein
MAAKGFTDINKCNLRNGTSITKFLLISYYSTVLMVMEKLISSEHIT